MSLSALLLLDASLAEPAAQSVLTPAVSWIESLVLGSMTTMLGVLAIAACGLWMLTGRIDARRGLTVVIGCFIVFGASTIASGLRSIGQDGSTPLPEPRAAPPPIPVPAPIQKPPSTYDPYAGASVMR